MSRMSARERALGDSMWESILEHGWSQVTLQNNLLENYRDKMDDGGLLLVTHEPCEIRPAKDTGIFLEVNTSTDTFNVKYARPENENMYTHQAVSFRTEHKFCPLCMDLLDYYCRYRKYWEGVSNKRRHKNKMLNNVVHHHSLASLSISADIHRCFICTTLSRIAINRYQTMFENREQLLGWRVECCFDKDDDPEKVAKMYFVVVDPERPKRPYHNYAPIYAFHLWPKSSYQQCFEVDSSLSDNGQTRMRELAKRWLGRCFANESNGHDICNEFVEDFFPTRVLDVEQARKTGLLRLVCMNPEDRDVPIKTKYCTLSYNWGPEGAKKNPILTKDNLDSRCQRGLQLDELPQTFQDALQVCHWFNLKYLWIDSLCIIQDSAADWHKEANIMSKTYRDAWLNISADRGDNPHVSLFQDTPPLDRSWPEVGSTLNDNSWYITPQADHFIRQIHDAPSFSRAWIHRERQLSRRILHFTAKGIAWECCETNRSSYASESFPGGVPFKYFLFADNKYQTGRFQKALIPDDEETYASWNDVCMVLSSKRITKESDRPIILSAIAEDFSRLLPSDQYAAGLWCSTMPHSLLWSVDGIENTSNIPAPEGGPTWSWLSAGKQVKLRYRARIKWLAVLADVVNVCTPIAKSVLPAKQNPFGPVENGRLEIRGFMREIRLELQESRRDWKLYVREKEVLEDDNIQTPGDRSAEEPEKQKVRKSWRKRLFGRTPKPSPKMESKEVKSKGDPWRYVGDSFDSELGGHLDITLDDRGVPVPLDCFALFITIDYISHIYPVGQKLDCLLLDKLEDTQNAFNRIGTLTVESDMALKLRYWVDQSRASDGFGMTPFGDVEITPLQFVNYEQDKHEKEQESKRRKGQESEGNEDQESKENKYQESKEDRDQESKENEDQEDEEDQPLKGEEALYRFDSDITKFFPWLTRLEEQVIILE